MGRTSFESSLFRNGPVGQRAGLVLVGTTTNGTMLDRESLIRLVDHELDVIAFSLAGTDQKNDTIRRGTSLEEIVQTIQILKELKHEKNTPRPEIHISYMYSVPAKKISPLSHPFCKIWR